MQATFYLDAIHFVASLLLTSSISYLKQVKRICPNDPDATKKLKECEKAVMKIKFEEAIAAPQSEKRSVAESIDFHTIGIHIINIMLFLFVIIEFRYCYKFLKQFC